MLLLTLIVLWAALVALVALHRELSVAWRASIVALLLAYGAGMTATLATSYAENRDVLAGFDERRSIADARLQRILDDGPDSLADARLVLAAKRLQQTVDRAAAAYGPGSWLVGWRYGMFPAFDGKVAARNIMTLVDIPPLLVWGEAASDRNFDDLRTCVDHHGRKFPFGMSATIGYIDRLRGVDQLMRHGAIRLIDSVNVAGDRLDDPRSKITTLVGIPHRVIATQAKMEALMRFGCNEFDEYKILTVAKSSVLPREQIGQWREYSPLFMDAEYIFPVFIGVNDVEARWMGTPPRPVLGSIDAIFALECETVGDWSDGQDAWTDPESGKSGVVHYVDARAYEFCKPGLVLTKWEQEPDMRMRDNPRAVGSGYNGLPAVPVIEAQMFPRGRTGPGG